VSEPVGSGALTTQAALSLTRVQFVEFSLVSAMFATKAGMEHSGRFGGRDEARFEVDSANRQLGLLQEHA
jgi:hypothetical protein